MQRSVTDQHASHLHRLQTRHRRNRPRTSYLKFHVANEGHLLLRRELKGHCPAWRPGNKTQLFLQCQGVNLDHYAINIKPKRGTIFFNLVIERQHRLWRVAKLHAVAYRQTPLFELH
ncbi:Uncharacterised protein [Enterobacter hormaechei]|nr:Uncharacterised protein [Enterobacter hormaechei]